MAYRNNHDTAPGTEAMTQDYSLFSGRSLLRVAPDGFVAQLLLAMVGTAGVFYVTILPALIGGLVDSLGFTQQQAGYVASANIYGAACGALLAVFLVKRFPWKGIVSGMLLALILFDILTPALKSPAPLMVIRFLAGIVGGLVTGIGFAVIARTAQPDRGYGALLVVQFGMGGIGLLLLPSLVSTLGHQVIFYTLAGFSVMALLTVPFLSDYHAHGQSSRMAREIKTGIARAPLLLILASIFLFQAANMGLFGFLERLGLFEQNSREWVSFSLATGAWSGIPGSLLVILLATRFGRLIPVAIAIFISLVGMWQFHHAADAQSYLYGSILLQFSWAFCLPYLFGICAELDKSGQMAAVGGMASKLGMATGPLLMATLLTDNSYGLVINLAIIMIVISALFTYHPAGILDKRKSSSQ